MVRMILTVWMIVGLSATAALAQSRPSIGAIDARQSRLEAAICAKSDVDGDTYRPFVCPARCDCFQPLGVPSSCQETAPGSYLIVFSTLPGTCGSNVCSNSTFQPCATGVPCQTPGESCSGTIIKSCKRACTGNVDCPPRPSGSASLTGVTTPDSPAVVTCSANGVQTSINSNDALQCLAQVEAVVTCP
ncbi:MAG: hypothetical protein IPK00_27685 [Deltaproteobacteria bacterium]|nr:hypothetical protein [Deltaproteobacteria bacterium]